MGKNQHRRCVCGKSSTYPICDFSHVSEKWQCQGKSGEVAEWCFVAGPHNLNLAEKLAAELGGIAAHTIDEKIIAEKEVLLTEGTDLEFLSVLDARISANERYVFALNVDPGLIGSVFVNAKIVPIVGETMELWQQIRTVCRQEFDQNIESTEHLAATKLKRVFLSHAVKDESILRPAVDYLRRFYEADIFLCADSIASGTNWQAEIVGNLQERESFLYLLSKNSLDSTFCAFEIGFASALEKNIAIISLDGSLPPVFAQHIQMNDVQRLRQRQPWLETDEALLEILLQVMSH